MAARPDNFPEGLVAAYAQIRAEWAHDPEELARLERLMHRPCMAKVFRALAALLPPDPEPWRHFLADAVLASFPAETWRDTIRPARRRFEQHRAAALRAGRDLVAALRELTDGMHGFLAPAELESPAALLERAAARKGYPPYEARRLAEPLAEDALRRVNAAIEGLDAAIAEAKAGDFDAVSPSRMADYPTHPAVVDLVAALLRTLEAWKPGQDGDLFPGQTQGGKAPQVYVRALAHALAGLAGSLGIVTPHGKLLSYDNLASVTRAALDLPDEPPEESAPSGYLSTPESRAAKADTWKPFDGEDVRRALEVAKD